MRRFTYRDQNDLEADRLADLISRTEPREDPKDAVSGASQEMKDDVNLNVIIKRMGITDGSIPPMATDPSYYGNFMDAPDFRTILDIGREAQEKFNQLPAAIRARFNYDPVALWEFVSDARNTEEAINLGLLTRKPAERQPEAKNDQPAATQPDGKSQAS